MGRGVDILYRMVRVLFEVVTLEPRPEGSKGLSHVVTWGIAFQAEGTACAKNLRSECVGQL